jgi:uncharacterized protein (DUF2235 family)
MNSEENRPQPGQRLVLFFDGTWNEPGDNTNVWRLSLMLADRGEDGIPQKSFYDEGVGTRWIDRVSGGAFGAGLSENVRKGYRWLMEHYNRGDEIFLFGFSRGAFTARSLSGVIARCGLLKPDAPMSFMQLYERYQKGDAVRPIYELIWDKKNAKDFDLEEKILLDFAYYQRNFIKMVGVWDTVGSIGVPFGNIKGISRRTLQFHNTRLSRIVQHSYQALAVDEQRKPYWAMLWTSFVPDDSVTTDHSDTDNRMVEQRWFSGAHANVGGGYRSDLLSQRPLAWMQEKAQSCGLGFRSHIHVTDEDLQLRPRDSYSEFLKGIWKIATFGRRFVRWVMADPVRKETRETGKRKTQRGWVETVNERIDFSVFRRCQLYPDYRPASLGECAERKKLDLEAIIADPEKYPELWQPVTTPGVESKRQYHNP